VLTETIPPSYVNSAASIFTSILKQPVAAIIHSKLDYCNSLLQSS